MIDIKSNKQNEMLKSVFPGRVAAPQDKRLRESGGSDDMAIDGSSVPVDFIFTPAGGERFVVEYVTLVLLDEGVFAPNVFGSLISPLTNGVLLSGQTNGVSRPAITNLVNNRDVFQCFFGAIGSAAPGAGANLGVFDSADWLGGKYEFTHSPFFLDGDKGDFIKMTIRDNLSAIDNMGASFRIWEDLTV